MANIARMPHPAPLPSRTTSTTSSLESVFETLHSRIVKDSHGLPMAFQSGSGPTEDEREAAMAAATAVRHALSQPATSEERAKAIRLLLGTLKMGQGTDAEAVAEGYMFVLDGVKSAALKRAVQLLAKGHAPERFSKTFMPSAPELLAFCEQVERDFLALAISTERLLALPEISIPEPMSEEHRAAMRDKLKALAGSVRMA